MECLELLLQAVFMLAVCVFMIVTIKRQNSFEERITTAESKLLQQEKSEQCKFEKLN